jgi:hypothetical protein
MKRVIALILMLTALSFGQTWVVEQVDSTAASGSPVELVKAADGRLWAGYGTRSGAARVACLGDSGWVFTDVCSAADFPRTGYRPFLAASPKGELCLACYDTNTHQDCLFRMIGDTWHRETQPFQDSGPTNTVAYDTSGRLFTLLEPWTARFVLGHEADSGWTSSFVVSLPDYAYWFLFDVGYLTAAADGSPWFLGFSGWDDYPYKWDYETALMHFTGDTWEYVWVPRGHPMPPMPLTLVPHGDGVGNLTSYDGQILCDSEPITGVADWPTVGLTYSAEDVPLVAWVLRDVPVFAFKTNRWHFVSIPGPAGNGGLDIEVDTSGQVVVVYSTQDSGLWCARGIDVVGVKESPEPQALVPKLEPTVLSGASDVTRLASSVIFDATGRRVQNPRPGVYFVREEPRAESPKPQPIRKVVVTK